MGWTVYNSDGKILQSAELGDNAVTSAKIANGAIVAADINASAAIEFSQMENLTTARALVTDGNGDILVSGVTTTELEKLDGLNSSTAELNFLAGVSGLEQADFTKLAAVTVTAAEVNHLSSIVASNVKVQIDAKAAVGSGTPSTQTLPDTAATGSSTEAARLDHVHTMPTAGGSLDSALTSFIRDGDSRSIYMLGAWPQGLSPTDDAKCGYGQQFAVDKNGANSGLNSSPNGGGWKFTSGDTDQNSIALFAGEARLRASDDFTIACRFNKESLSIFGFGLAADVQGYRPSSQNDVIAIEFVNDDQVNTITDIGGTRSSTPVATGISGEHDAKIVISGDGASVAFYVDGALEATHTANIPTAIDLYLYMNVSSYGAAYRRCIVYDFFAYREV